MQPVININFLFNDIRVICKSNIYKTITIISTTFFLLKSIYTNLSKVKDINFNSSKVKDINFNIFMMTEMSVVN